MERQEKEEGRWRLRVFALCSLGLALAVAVLYGRTAGFAYLRLDDWGYTAGCPFVVGGLTWDNVAAAFSRLRYGGVWMPLTYLSYAADVTLFGGGWGVHHAVNAALHAVNAIVVFLFILSLLPPSPTPNSNNHKLTNSNTDIAAALAAAMLWAVHPQRVEAVAWIASRKEELWTLFALLGLMAWMRRRFGLGILLCLCACLSKPTAVCFPLLALLVARRPNGRASCPQTAASHWGRRILPYVPLFLIAFVTGLVAIVSQTHPEGMAPVPVVDVPFLERLVRAAVALGLSLAQMLVPWGVHFDYMDASPLFFVFGLLALVSILALFAIGRLRASAPTNQTIKQSHNQTILFPLLFPLLFFLLAWLPVSGLFGSFGEHARADRFLYLPSVGIAVLVACVLSRTGRAARCAALALAVVYAVLAWPVVGSYRNDYTAFARALTFDPDHWRALQHVGSESCARLGRMDEGIEMLRRSYRYSPRDSTAEVLAYALACRGNKADGSEIKRLCRAAAARPVADRRGMMAEALGIATLWEGKWSRAEAYLRASLAAPERFYSNAEAKFRLAEALAGGGDAAGAKALLRPLALSDDKAVRLRALRELKAIQSPPRPNAEP